MCAWQLNLLNFDGVSANRASECWMLDTRADPLLHPLNRPCSRDSNEVPLSSGCGLIVTPL